jgi:splicing factor 3A subunit 2
MDYSSRPGQKTGTGALLSSQELAIARRDRLRKLALETIDLKNDPYLSRNQLGGFECRLCLTLHSNEASYLAHTQAKKHQVNLARRAAADTVASVVVPEERRPTIKRFKKIGRPVYRMTRVMDEHTELKGIYFEVELPQIAKDVTPCTRIMSAYEQRVEVPDPDYQYIVIAAEPYETIAFKIPNLEVDTSDNSGAFENWDPKSAKFSMQVFLKERTDKALPVVYQRPVISGI